jgi:biopolymer transport protein ExbB
MMLPGGRWVRGPIVLAALFCSAATAQPATDLDALLDQVRNEGRQRAVEFVEREREFALRRDEQRERLATVSAELEAERLASEQLRADFERREQELATLSEQLQVRVGTLGELFGVARQAAGDVKAVVDASLVSAELPERRATAARLAQVNGLPGMRDLNELRVLLLEEMTESARVSRFPGEIVGPDGRRTAAEVVRIGTFNVIAGDRFLEYRPDNAGLHALARQPAGRYRTLARDLAGGEPGTVLPMTVDPTRGSLLAMLIDSPGLAERIRQGGWIGYVIIALGVAGALLAAERLISLTAVARRVRRQLASPEADRNNPLGRLMAVYEAHREAALEVLELKLEEAILRETPVLERRQTYIKVIAAVAPLLGLLGTVVGMIVTFQAIVLFGTGDPQLMANGISQALVTTALGLCVAIPLVFLYSLVAGRSRELVDILEEQSAGVIARRAEAATPAPG